MLEFRRKDFLDHGNIERTSTFNQGIGKNNIHAPISGNVLKVCCSENKMVRKGEAIVVIESMKMENEIRTENDIEVKKIVIKAGDYVREGELLVEINENK